MNSKNALYAAAIGVITCLTACGGGSTSTPATTTVPTTPPAGNNSLGAINAISSTNSVDPATTYGASLKAVAMSTQGSLGLLNTLTDIQNVWGDASAADCMNANISGSANASNTGFGTFLGAGAISASETVSNCGGQWNGLLAITGAVTITGTSTTITTAAVTQSWTSPITASDPFGAAGNLISLAPGSIAIAGSNFSNTGNGTPTLVFSNTSADPILSYQAGPASKYSISNLNGSAAFATCPNNGTCPVTIASGAASGLLANVAIGTATYAVTVITPVFTPSIVPSSSVGSSATPTGGSIGVAYGNATCGTLTVTFLSSGLGFVMSCATAPSLSQQVLYSSSDFQAVWAASQK